MKTKILTTFAILLALTFSAQAQQIQSVYTDLGDKKCKTLKLNVDEGGFYLGECAGTRGYKLQVSEGDLRQTVSVVAPNRKIHPLEFGNFFGGFSAVGEKAEWRVKGNVPIGLIIRFNVSENPEDSSKTTSYLTVSKITKTKICLVDILKPGASQNILARQIADSAASKPCKASNFE